MTINLNYFQLFKKSLRLLFCISRVKMIWKSTNFELSTLPFCAANSSFVFHFALFPLLFSVPFKKSVRFFVLFPKKKRKEKESEKKKREILFLTSLLVIRLVDKTLCIILSILCSLSLSSTFSNLINFFK